MQAKLERKGFTLVELLVVIGILGILGGVMLSVFGGSTESARSAKCLANMRNLATACQSYGMSVGCYPLAASMEYSTLDESQGIRNVKEIFHERAGWISWASQGAYGGRPTSSVANSGWFTSAYEANEDVATHCLTNGVLWRYVAANEEVYLCPSHVKAAQRKGKKAHWSYAMNAYFGGDVAMKGETMEDYGIGYGGLKRADRILLFAELPFYEGIDDSLKASDPVLQYKGLAGYGGSTDTLAFNHMMGKQRCAHVVFADGHIDRLMLPRSGEVNSEELLEWLCEGKDIGFSGSKYEKLND